jgi:hypothetical protein
LFARTDSATARRDPMKITVKTAKPRNPFVMAAARRNAGSHRPANAARRQQDQRSLRLELQRLRHSP